VNRALALVGAALFGASFFAFAQATAPKADGKGGQRQHQMREHIKGAHEACKDKPDRMACMHGQMCAKAADPAKCLAEGKARMNKRLDERQAMHEACTGKRGDQLQRCLGEQHKGRKGHRGRGDQSQS